MILAKLTKFSKITALSTLAVATSLVTAMPAITLAQGEPGLTIFSGVGDRSDILDYHIDFPGRNARSRYKLRIPASKMELGVSQVVIIYPAYYKGRLDPDEITVGYGSRYRNEAPIDDVVIEENALVLKEQGRDQPYHRLHIYLSEPIEAENPVEIKLENVRNPRWGGTFYFHARLLSPGDVPLPRYAGTWILTLNY